MHSEDGKNNNQEHPPDTGVQLDLLCQFLNSFTCLHNFKDLEKSQNSQKPIKSR
jgi:hypothetical protein